MKNLRKYFGRKSLIVALAIVLMAVILFWHPYGLLLAGGLLALCAGALGWSVWRQARYMLRKKKYGYCPKDAPLDSLHAIKRTIDTSVIDLSDPRTNYIMSK